MKSLSQQSTTIFFELLQQMDRKTRAKFYADGFMPLSIELIGGIITSFGSGLLYSLAHYYEQNGDLMRDPEMCFIVIKPKEENNYTTKVFPYMYQQDGLGLFQESVVIDNQGILSINMRLQYTHAEFAHSWLINIQQQGFLK